MKAFLLAAGVGSRLRPLTEVLPKPLVPVDNVPLLLFPLSQIRKAGIRELGINLHHHPEMIATLLGDGVNLGLRLRFFRETKLLGTGGAIRNAREFLGDSDFLLLNGDTLIDLDLTAMIEFHRSHGGIATLAVSETASVERFGGLAFEPGKKLRSLVERGGKAPEGCKAAVFCGASILKPEIFSFLESGGESPCVLRQGVFPAIQSGESAFAFPTANYFADLGSPGRYLEANLALRRGEGAKRIYPGALELFQKLRQAGLPPLVEEGAEIGSEVVLGPGSRVGKGARLDKTVLWEGSSVAAGLTIREAVVFRGEEILPLVPRHTP